MKIKNYTKLSINIKKSIDTNLHICYYNYVL